MQQYFVRAACLRDLEASSQKGALARITSCTSTSIASLKTRG